MFIAFLSRECYRSLDGGTTWQHASTLWVQGVPDPHPECGNTAATSSYPQAASDGSLWVTFSCNGNTYLARSTDEAATWPIIHKSDGTPLTVPTGWGLLVDSTDTAGNLYLFQKNGSELLFQISQDGGLSWSAPLNMTAPSARETTIGQFAAAIRAPGQIAVSYFAARSDVGNDGYISVTHDALKADGTPNPDAVFYAATVNSPERLLQSSKGVGTDYIAVDIAPDGSPWASFYSDCFTKPNGQFEDPSCAQTNGQTANGVPPLPSPGSATTVGRLKWQ
jgi:hypothetical protein